MGWLRDLMATSDPPIASFGRLADSALEHPAWPKDTQPKARSLATLFSKLDRDQDLEWLADRPEVQRILAELMRRPLGDVQQALPRQQPMATGRLLPLSDVRFARELDLTKERLCPGLPEVLYEPATWGALFWQAPSGSGRSLMGAWLAARGLASYVTVDDELDPVALPPRGPLFVEVQSAAPSIDWDAWYELLGAARRPVCVAAAAHAPELESKSPRSADADRAGRFRAISSPSVSEVLPELVDWMERRLGGDGNFDAERALLFMQRVALPSGAVQSLGDALGLLGMLDELRPRTLSGRSLDEIAESFVRARIDESSRESTASTWLNRNAFPALRGTIAQLVTESDRSPSSPRTFDEWLELVPNEFRQGVDVEWMRTALREEKSSDGNAASKSHRLRGDDVVRAARKLPPGGYQLLRAFEHARLLVSDGERLRLRPAWLVTLLHARATDDVLASSPMVWGETLLRPAHAARTMRSLWGRAQRGKLEPLYAALELDAPENPACIAALEAAGTVAGLTLAAGGSMPSDLVSDLWDELEHCAVFRAGASPSPRLPHPAPLAREEPLLDRGAWLLAYLALAERSETKRRGRRFDPWRADPTTGTQRTLRDAVYPPIEALVSRLSRAAKPSAVSPAPERPEPLVAGIYTLVDRLRRSAGPAAEIPGALELPSAVCDALARDGADFSLLERLSELPGGHAALGEVARARGTPFSALARQLWSALARAPRLPEALEPERAQDAFARALWGELPAEVLKRRVQANQSVPWALLLPHHYAALLGANLPLPDGASEHAPRAALFEALETRGLNVVVPSALSQLWRKFPREMLALLARRLDHRQLEGLALLLSSATPESSRDAASLVPELIRLLTLRADVMTFPRDDLAAMRSWLADCVARRVPGWRDAYPLFHTIEQSFAALGVGLA